MDVFTPETGDAELLKAFATDRNERAFENLVRRHVGLVHGLALRRTGDTSLADEVTQNVFTLLAQKSVSLQGHPTLGGWMAKTTAFESMRLSRNEQTRRRKMHALQDDPSQTLSTTPDDPAWEEAQTMLDQALASLSDSDRNAVVLRFYEKKNFKRIAELLGKSDDACQKQVSRAIEKLSRWFQRRGIALSSGAVITGLAATLDHTQAQTFSGSSASLAGKVLESSPAIHTTASSSSGVLILLMKSKVLSTLIILGALALSAGAGWRMGASQRTSAVFDNASGTIPNVETNETTIVVNEAQRQASLRQLLETARREAQGIDVNPTARIRAAARVALIHPADLPEAMSLLEQFEGGLYRSRDLAALLLERWALHDGASACEFALEKMDIPLMGIHPVADPLRSWASHDPQAAMAWFQQNKDPDGFLIEASGSWGRISAIRWIMGAWALKDPLAAAQAYRNLETEAEKSGAHYGIMELAKRSVQRTALLDALWEPDIDKVSTTLRDWGAYQPSELAKWIDSKNDEQVNRFALAKPVLSQWLLQDTQAAIDWWLLNRESDQPFDRKLGHLIDAWSETDAFSAAEWLADQDLTQEHTPAIKSLSQQLTREDPERAFAWAQAIPDGAERKSALRYAYRAWHRKAPDEAETALRTAKLDDAIRKALEESVHQSTNLSRG